jgi:hypothetical protein
MEFDVQVKQAVYRHFAETGRRPTPADVVLRIGADVERVVAAYQRLRALRLLVLEDDGASIRFRSEERIREWCQAHGTPVRPLVRIDQLWTLATTWYSTRLQDNSRRPQPNEMRAIFAGLGLEGDFWDPLSDTFG